MHPVHVEAVASIVGRADLLCGVFYLFAVHCYSNSLRTNVSVYAVPYLGIFSAFYYFIIIYNIKMHMYHCLVMSYTSAMGATLSKEIGLTGERTIFVFVQFLNNFLLFLILLLLLK